MVFRSLVAMFTRISFSNRRFVFRPAWNSNTRKKHIHESTKKGTKIFKRFFEVFFWGFVFFSSEDSVFLKVFQTGHMMTFTMLLFASSMWPAGADMYLNSSGCSEDGRTRGLHPWNLLEKIPLRVALRSKRIKQQTSWAEQQRAETWEKKEKKCVSWLFVLWCFWRYTIGFAVYMILACVLFCLFCLSFNVPKECKPIVWLTEQCGVGLPNWRWL